MLQDGDGHVRHVLLGSHDAQDKGYRPKVHTLIASLHRMHTLIAIAL